MDDSVHAQDQKRFLCQPGTPGTELCARILLDSFQTALAQLEMFCGRMLLLKFFCFFFTPTTFVLPSGGRHQTLQLVPGLSFLL